MKNIKKVVLFIALFVSILFLTACTKNLSSLVKYEGCYYGTKGTGMIVTCFSEETVRVFIQADSESEPIYENFTPEVGNDDIIYLLTDNEKKMSIKVYSNELNLWNTPEPGSNDVTISLKYDSDLNNPLSK